ncbi:MAG: hypothetical protein FJX76_26495, partial [Armatimonadetes bacterium]|nr:hypothetical protein [Armatimonadota bacterium]
RHLAWHLAIHPFQAARTLGRFASEFVRGVHQRKRDDIPQDFTHGRLKPALWSALQNVVLTDAAVRAMTARMAKGDPAVFADLPGFDDISHALGPDRAMRSLKAIDRNLGILMKAAAHGDRKYNLVIYGDHGQTANVRFSEQYGQSLGQYVLSLMPGASAPAAHPVEAEPNLPHVHLADTDGDSRMTMLDFGTGAHLYFHFTDEAANGADVEAVYPGVLGKIAAHPGVGFIVTRDGDATEILGKQGRVRVQGGQVQVQGVNPLVQYGHENVTVWQLHDQAHRHGAGDVMAFGGFVGDKIVNFALHPQLGTHGGLGNTQDVAFLIQPAGMGLDMRNVDQSSELYDQLRAHLPSDSPAALP